MAKHNSQAAAKQARNDAYADRFKRRNRSERKAARRARTVVRETRWLVAHGIDPVSPTVKRGRRR